jgi:tetratricopeptide (TPR) repeat protein
MTITVSFVEHLLARARQSQQQGRTADAIAQLTRLAAFPELSPAVAEEVQARLGELHLKRRRFRQARRHLLAALALNPDSSRYHRLLGLALASDLHGDQGRAWRHYGRALALAPGKARWRGEAGLLAVRLGRTDEGLALLRDAHEQAPEDPVILGKLVKGLCLAGQIDEAERLVGLARFRAPRCGALAQLWLDLRLAGVRREQDSAAALARAEAEPVLLPFVRAAGGETEGAARYDGAHALPGPHLVRLRARRGCRRAP